METNKMTFEKLYNLIGESVKKRWIFINETDREEAMAILRDIEGVDDTLMFDLIADSEGHPSRIQVFTDVKYKEKTYSIILNFDLCLYGEESGRAEQILKEFEKAKEIKERFNS